MPKYDLSSKNIFNDLSADISIESCKYCEKRRIENHLTDKISQIISYFTFSGKYTLKKMLYQNFSNDY